MFKPLMNLLAGIAACASAAIIHLDCADAANAATQAAITMPEKQPAADSPHRNGEKIPVQIALRVINLSDIDEVAQRFRVVAYLQAQWKDSRLDLEAVALFAKRCVSPG